MAHKEQKLSDEEKQSRYQYILDWNASEEGQVYYNKLNKEKLEKEQEYLKNPKLCMECSAIIPYEKRLDNNTFCCHRCSAKYNNRKRKESGWKMSTEAKQKISESVKNNEECKKHTEQIKSKRIKKTCLICQKEFNVPKCEEDRTYCSKECYLKDPNKKGGSGGIREGGGHGKSGWYKGYFCNSTYELVWIIYNIDHNIPFIRNTEGFPYIYENEEHKYYPDFILEDGSYVEIKGYDNPQHRAKIAQFPHSMKVLFEKDLQVVFDYVKSTYGTNFIELYEGNPHKIKKNKCQICGAPSKKKFCSSSCAGKNRVLTKRKNPVDNYHNKPRNKPCKLCGKLAKNIFCSQSCAGKHMAMNKWLNKDSD